MLRFDSPLSILFCSLCTINCCSFLSFVVALSRKLLLLPAWGVPKVFPVILRPSTSAFSPRQLFAICLSSLPGTGVVPLEARLPKIRLSFSRSIPGSSNWTAEYDFSLATAEIQSTKLLNATSLFGVCSTNFPWCVVHLFRNVLSKCLCAGLVNVTSFGPSPDPSLQAFYLTKFAPTGDFRWLIKGYSITGVDCFMGLEKERQIVCEQTAMC